MTQYDYKDPGSEYSISVNGVSYEFDQRVLDAEGRCTYYQHDDLGRVTMVLYPTNLREVIEYYPSGQRKSRSVYSRELGGADFQKVSYEYDTCGRLSSKKYPGDSVSSPNRIEYTYDSFGSLAQILDKRAEGNVGGTDTISYEYDILGRVTTITRWDGVTLNYTYTSAGQRASVEVKDETDTRMLYTRYVYDLMGRLTEVYENNAGTGETQIAGYAYDKDGSNNPRMTVTYNQVTSGSRTYVSDSLGRIRTITNAAGGTTVSSFDYAVSGSTDGMGRRTHAYINLAAASGQDGTPTTVYNEYYTYDKLGRLVDWDVNSGTFEHDYTFDDVGNRLTIDEGSYTFQEAGQTYGVSSADSDILASDPTYYYDYDANGSVIKRTLKTDADYFRLYWYDWEQRLTKVEDYDDSQNPGNPEVVKTIEYSYDPMGNLIKRVEDGSSTTTYVQDIDSSLPLVLIEETSSYTAKYTYGNDRLKVSRSGEYYYFYDGLGSTRTITDTSGVIKARYLYDVYGKPISSECHEDASVSGQPFLFTGELYDSDTEHIYLRARWYDPNTGRFITRDTYKGQFDKPNSRHQYVYTENDPANRIDPSGYYGVAAIAVTVAIIATVAAIAYHYREPLKAAYDYIMDLPMKAIDWLLGGYDGPSISKSMELCAKQWESSGLEPEEYYEFAKAYREAGYIAPSFGRQYINALAWAGIMNFAPGKLTSHYRRHGWPEFGFATKAKYELAAEKFLRKQPTPGTWVGWRSPNGPAGMARPGQAMDFVRWDSVTKEFAVCAEDGITIRTYMKNEGCTLNYFLKNVDMWTKY